jgi:DNA-binding CsgD family transcriptional regulator
MQLGISRERVRHLIETALEKLRAMSSIQALFGTALSTMSVQSSGTSRISTNS